MKILVNFNLRDNLAYINLREKIKLHYFAHYCTGGSLATVLDKP